MASTASLLPQQQQPVAVNSGASSSNVAGNSSGSIGPFFAAVSVLTILAIISCVLGRICTRDRHSSNTSNSTMSPLEIFKNRDCFGWLKRRSGHHRSIVNLGHVEVGAKVMDLGEDTNDINKAKDQDPGKVEDLPN
ncbi:hypothetical protein Pint_16381 [Pistacia integerrima]|uniref:Uncharacterized protein n=1 Tax=Pistacia integerrima TaxID=434235 RepID=A0ACC0ZCS3_9ROSI|nr:hypothetical protein Pint_16381 [Pistacia integerrima]